MQTFLPYPDFSKSLDVLDYKRLGKQRVEAMQILNAILNRPSKSGKKYKGWINHPCTVMWKKYVNALKLYHNICIDLWIKKGYKNNMKYEIIEGEIVMPDWLGNEKFHASHRSNLLRKNQEFYSKYNWKDNPENPYIWMNNNGELYIKIKKQITILT